MTGKIVSILSISYVEPLLRTRQWILETAGFRVTSALGFTQAIACSQDKTFDLAIMGHSIPRDDKQALLGALQKDSECRILSLCRPGDLPLSGANHSIDSWEGPEALIAAIHHTLDMDGKQRLGFGVDG